MTFKKMYCYPRRLATSFDSIINSKSKILCDCRNSRITQCKPDSVPIKRNLLSSSGSLFIGIYEAIIDISMRLILKLSEKLTSTNQTLINWNVHFKLADYWFFIYGLRLSISHLCCVHKNFSLIESNSTNTICFKLTCRSQLGYNICTKH